MLNQPVNPEQVKKYLESLSEDKRAEFLTSNFNVDIQEGSEPNKNFPKIPAESHNSDQIELVSEEIPKADNFSLNSHQKSVAKEVLSPDKHFTAEEMKRALEEGINDPQKLMQSLMDRKN